MTVNWRTLGDIDLGIWTRTLYESGSPLKAVAADCYKAASPHTALCLAMLRVESFFWVRFNANTKESNNPLNLRPPVGGGYMQYDDPVEGIRAWRERITDPEYKDGIYAKTVTIADLVHVYAPSSDGNNEAAYIASIAVDLVRWGITPQEVTPAMATNPAILLIAGHRSHGDAGNPKEKALTPALARSYRDAFRAAGYTCVWLQEADGDNDPDDTVGGLDTVSSKAAAWIAKQPGESILFDLHYEGSPARGCFAIIPDITGLKTNAPVFQEPSDTWENNKLDRELGRALVNGIAVRTGLPLRQGIREPGLMDESETGVGGQGYRLATFAYTSPWGYKCVRLVVEHGNHTHPQDLAIIMQPDFTDKCAAAAVAAVKQVYGAVPAPVPKPDPVYATPLPITWKAGDYGWKKLGDVSVYCLEAEVEVVRATTPLAWADGDKSDGEKAPNAGPKLKQGERFKVIGSFYNLNEKGQTVRWLVRASDNARIIGGSCRPLLPIKQ